MSAFRLTGADRILVGILVPLMLLAAALVLLFAPSEKTGSLAENPSTFFNAPHGVKAAYLALSERGFAVERIRRPLLAANLDGLSGLVILDPVSPLLQVEDESLRAWVKAGGRLLVAPPDFAPGKDPDKEASLTDWFQFQAPLMQGQRREVQELPTDADLLEGVGQLAFKGPRRLESKAPFAESLHVDDVRTLAQDADGGLLAAGTLGEGQIVVLADPYPMTNEGLRDPDNDLLLANLASWLAADEGSIGFDEYHHGFVAREMSPVAILRLLLSGPWALAVAQAALAGMLALWAAGARFGKPRDLVRGSRRRQREFAQAAGGLLAEARATRFLYETLARSYRERMCRTLKLPVDIEDRELVRALRRAADISITWAPPRIDGAASPGPLTDAEVLDRVRQWRQALALLETRPAAVGAQRPAVAAAEPSE